MGHSVSSSYLGVCAVLDRIERVSIAEWFMWGLETALHGLQALPLIQTSSWGHCNIFAHP